MTRLRPHNLAAVARTASKWVGLLVLALWLCLFAALLGRYAWPLDLFAHFRVQYAVLFAATSAVLLLIGNRRLAAAAALGVLLSSVPLIGYLSFPAPRAQAQTTPFRLLTFNVWYRSSDHARVAAYLEQARADAVVLQEISTDQAARLQAHLPSYPYAYLEPGVAGAVVYSRWPILHAQRLALSSAQTPAAQVVLDWNGTKLTLIGVHLHWPLGATNWRLRNQELQQLGEFARTHSGPLLLAGDLNITPWSGYFQQLLKRAGLSDCAAGHGVSRSWPARLPALGIRIDHCLASRHWRSVNVSIGPPAGSDHLPVVADLTLRAL